MTQMLRTEVKTNERFTRADNSKGAWPQAPDFIDALDKYSEDWSTGTLASQYINKQDANKYLPGDKFEIRYGKNLEKVMVI